MVPDENSFRAAAGGSLGNATRSRRRSPCDALPAVGPATGADYTPPPARVTALSMRFTRAC